MKHMLVSLLFFFTPLVNASEKVRVLAVDEPPGSFINEHQHADGLATEIVRAIQQRVHNDSKIEVLPETRVLKIAEKSPNTLFYGFTLTPEREDKFHAITLLFRKSWVMYALEQNKWVLNDLESARAIAKIGVVLGDIRHQHLAARGFTNLRAANTHETNVKMLMRERVDLLFYERTGMAYIANKLEVPISEFYEVLETAESDVYLFMSKHDTDPEILEHWRKAAAEIKSDGTFQQISEKWSARIYDTLGIRAEFADGDEVLSL